MAILMCQLATHTLIGFVNDFCSKTGYMVFRRKLEINGFRLPGCNPVRNVSLQIKTTKTYVGNCLNTVDAHNRSITGECEPSVPPPFLYTPLFFDSHISHQSISSMRKVILELAWCTAS